jgi:hypothetical protein
MSALFNKDWLEAGRQGGQDQVCKERLEGLFEAGQTLQYTLTRLK